MFVAAGLWCTSLKVTLIHCSSRWLVYVHTRVCMHTVKMGLNWKIIRIHNNNNNNNKKPNPNDGLYSSLNYFCLNFLFFIYIDAFMSECKVSISVPTRWKGHTLTTWSLLSCVVDVGQSWDDSDERSLWKGGTANSSRLWCWFRS